MVKITLFALAASAVVPVLGFAPSASTAPKAFVRPKVILSMAEGEEGGKLVPIKEETVQFTAGIVGGVAGLMVGGPVLGAIGAALANYATKNENEAGEVVNAVSKTSIEVFNYLSTLDAKYELLTKAKGQLEKTLEKLKSSGGDSSAIAQVESALAETTSKIKEINDEYDLVGAGTTALGVVGDLVEKAIKKAGELNDEYKLTDKAITALKGAVDKAASTAKEAAAAKS